MKKAKKATAIKIILASPSLECLANGNNNRHFRSVPQTKK